MNLTFAASLGSGGAVLGNDFPLWSTSTIWVSLKVFPFFLTYFVFKRDLLLFIVRVFSGIS